MSDSYIPEIELSEFQSSILLHTTGTGLLIAPVFGAVAGIGQESIAFAVLVFITTIMLLTGIGVYGVFVSKVLARIDTNL